MDIEKIIFAEIIEREDGRLYKFKLENGSEYTTENKLKAKDLFNEYASQYGLSVEDLMKNADRVSLPKISKKEESVETHTESTIPRERRTEKFKKVPKEKGKKLKITLSIVSAAVIIGVGTCHLIKNSKYNNKRIKDGQELIQIVLNSDPNTSNTKFEDNLNVATQDHQTIQDKLYDMTYNNLNMSDEEFKQAMYEISMMSFANIQEISKYINGSKLTGDAYYCNFESIFKPNSVDYQIIKYFSTLKSNIVNSAYTENDKKEVKDRIKTFYERFISFAIENSGYNASNSNGKFIVKMDDLTPLAKHCIYSLMSGVTSIDYNYKNGTYNRENIIDFINSEYNDVYKELRNNSVSK